MRNIPSHESHLEKPVSLSFHTFNTIACKAANDSLPHDIMDQREALKLRAFSSPGLPFVSAFPQCEAGLLGFVISLAAAIVGANGEIQPTHSGGD